MKTLGRLSLAAVCAAYAEVLLGSWTRINGAGMTCPDYPLCRGAVIPQMGGGTVWEWTHRLLAGILSLLVLAVLGQAWRLRAGVRFAVPAGAVIAVLFGFQVFLGAATVHLSNSPASVVWHWGTAMAFVASLCVMAILAFGAATRTRTPRPDGLLRTVLAISAMIAFLTMCVGAYVSSSGAGLACIDIPGCAGRVVVYTPGQYVQMLHRFIAAACLLSASVAFALAWAHGISTRLRLATTLAFVLVLVQVLLGLLNVALRLPVDLREAHAANAALVFLAFVCATAFAVLENQREYIRAR
ncbi:MAG: heme A synthase [Candidatus Baltobacteraceae bacterium]